MVAGGTRVFRRVPLANFLARLRRDLSKCSSVLLLQPREINGTVAAQDRVFLVKAASEKHAESSRTADEIAADFALQRAFDLSDEPSFFTMLRLLSKESKEFQDTHDIGYFDAIAFF
jgi:hypothetical protein